MPNTATSQKSSQFLYTLSLASVFLFLTPQARAKVQLSHWGIGVTNAGPGYGSPQLSAEWELNRTAALEILLGIDTVQNSNSLSLGARMDRHLFIEESLDFSAFFGGGLLNSSSATGTSSSGFYFETGTLVNFYMSNLPNLGIQLGSGFRLESPGSSRIRTVFFGGFHYYF